MVGCGRVGQTLARLLNEGGLCRVQDLKARRVDNATQAARFIGAGRAVAQLSDMRPADLWMLSVPDTQVAAVASELAAVWPGQAAPQRLPTAFHCSGFLQAAELAPLGRHGCQLASVHPVLNFASASSGVAQFAGTPCGIEGEAAALDVVRPLMQAIGGRCFAVQGEHKALYHAAAVFSSNYLVVLQAIAREAWQAAGVPPELLGDVHAALLQATVHNTLQLGPAAAITGPAARGDAEVVRQQQACVHDWHPQAGAIYQEMAVLARRLALTGQTGAQLPATGAAPDTLTDPWGPDRHPPTT